MQLFDRMCGITERFLPELFKIMEDAAPFQLDITPYKSLRKSLSPEEIETINRDFQLPFPVTAIEDRAGCTILIDPLPNQQGLNLPRAFIDILALDQPEAHQHCSNTLSPEDAAWFREMSASMPPGVCSVVVGALHQTLWMPKEVLVQVKLDLMVLASEERLYTRINADNLPDEMYQAMVQQGGTNAQSAIEEVLMMRSTDRLCIRSQSANEVMVVPGRIPRSTRRVAYHSLTIPEAQELLNLPPHVGGSTVDWADRVQVTRDKRVFHVYPHL